MTTRERLVQVVREQWLIILAVLVNLAIAGPLAADWKSDVCYLNGKYVECCTDCIFFCACGDAPAP